jgi:hypothetical protein
MRSDGIVHHKLPHDARISTRNPVSPETKDEERESTTFEDLAYKRLTEQIAGLARGLENRSHPVDEYNAAAISGAGSSPSVTVQPTYEFPEKITSIIVTGPAGVITLRLGDRIWSLTIPATGILVIAPVAILLGRGDDRTLTGAPGVYTLELMGYGDKRFTS